MLAIILEFALDFSKDSAPPPPLFEASSRLAQERKRAVDAVTAYQNLRLSCVAIRNASEKDLVLRAVLRKAGFFVPSVLWNGGTLTKAFFIQMKQLDDRIMHQKKQEKTLQKPGRFSFCNMFDSKKKKTSCFSYDGCMWHAGSSGTRDGSSS